MACTTDIVLNGVIREHRVYMTVWSPFVGETLHLQTDAGNEHDTHAVIIIKNSAGGWPCTQGDVRDIFLLFTAWWKYIQ